MAFQYLESLSAARLPQKKLLNLCIDGQHCSGVGEQQHRQFCIQREADVQHAQLLSLSASLDGWNTNGKLIIFKPLTNCHSEPITRKADVGHHALDVTLLSETLEFDSPGS